MSGAKGDVVVVGSTNVDVVVGTAVHPVPGETVLGTDLTMASGGKGANQAVAAARLGACVRFVGAVGDDELAATATSGLRDAGVDLAGLARTRGATGVAVITVAADAENTIVVAPGANSAVDGELVSRRSDVLAAAAVVVVQGEIPRDGIEAASSLAGGRLVVNLAPVVPVDPAVLLRADPLVVNEHEARGAVRVLEGWDAGTGDEDATAAGTPATSGPHVVNGADEAAARRILDLGVPSLVVTLGARGALVGYRGGELVAVPSPRVDAVDTTGAGDAFVGALAGALAAGQDIVDAARFAARVGAFSVRSRGAQRSYPTSDDDLP